jgi:mannose-6-phosphate isomerase-like protein (cupin superfamily)
MADWTLKRLEEIPDILGDYPGEMRMGARELGSEQVAFTYRRMPPDTGGKGGYGHRHETQEEIYFVASGTLTFKLEDDILEASAGTVINVPCHVLRSVHNESDADAELVIVSRRGPDGEGDAETVEGFWPA